MSLKVGVVYFILTNRYIKHGVSLGRMGLQIETYIHYKDLFSILRSLFFKSLPPNCTQNIF